VTFPLPLPLADPELAAAATILLGVLPSPVLTLVTQAAKFIP